MFLLKMIRKFFKGLSGAESPTQIALGFGLGLVWGMVPAGSGLGIALLALLLLFKVSFPFAVVAGTLAKLVRLSAFGDATAGLVGFTLLEHLPLQAFWTWLLTLPVLGFLGLERWHVMGGAAVGAAAGAASFFPVRFLVGKYREVVVERLSRSKAFKTGTNPWLLRLIKWTLLGSGK